MRRALQLIVIACILAAAGWLLWHWDGQAAASADPWRAVPSEAAVIIEVPDALAAWDRFAHASLLWRSWETSSGARCLAQQLARSARLVEADATVRGQIGTPTVLVALLRSGQGLADPLFIGAADAVSPQKLGALLGVKASSMAAFTEGRVVETEPDTCAGALHACLREGIWLLSPSVNAIDESVLQLERGTPITSDPVFAKARATLGQATEAHVLVHLARAGALLSTVWEPARIDRLAMPRGWLALDLATKPDALLLNGLLVPEDDDAWLASLHAQGAGAWNIARLIPADAVQLELHQLGDPEAALRARDQLEERLRGTESAAEWMLGTVGVARGATEDRLWSVAETADPERAMAELNAPCADAACDTVHHRGIRITHMRGVTPHELLLGRSTKLPQQPWWCLMGQHVVMSDDPAALRASIDVWLDGGSLAEQPAARAWFKRMGDEAAYTYWCDPARGNGLFKNGLSAAHAERFSTWLPILGGLNAASAQLAPAPGGLLHVSMGLQHSQSASGNTVAPASGDLLWACEVGAPLTIGPFIVVNHTNNMREVLVQDSLHRIHLISAAGKLLWSRQLDGPLLGAVHQVDRFKNGKLQLLLGTARTAHLIDRNGKDVGLPFKLPVEAAAPLAILDYEGAREYRVIVPLSDGRLLNVDLDWAAVQGWLTPKLEAAPADAVRHLRIAGKDNLMAVDAEGVMHLFDRKGNAREALKLRMPRVQSVLAVEAGQQLATVQVIWMDQDLAIHRHLLNGEARPLDLEVRDIDGDGVPEALSPAGTESPKGIAAVVVAEDRLAFARIDVASGRPWRYSISSVKAPAGMGGTAVLGDLNLDGALELVGGEGGMLIARRLPTP